MVTIGVLMEILVCQYLLAGA